MLYFYGSCVCRIAELRLSLSEIFQPSCYRLRQNNSNPIMGFPFLGFYFMIVEPVQNLEEKKKQFRPKLKSRFQCVKMRDKFKSYAVGSKAMYENVNGFVLLRTPSRY